ncbi:MAG: DeoR/GlpR transcriptional regulator [Solirubrobacterales bacterium]|nr:DeoR/GlpR transcriptional regulator [Solirubrobacterales bacterium]MCB8971171.1 DeoR/GlpR transcriptional regulator [Thermoleophilales bacterium]MCO5325974.1 DeoR/GlpR family DNA-binding transcription regulator [Solirubrobacterales bacterium]
MSQADRLSSILDELSSGGSVRVAELSDRFGVSVATIRRDLELLEEQRLVSRVHGGAVARGLLYELPLRYKVARHQGEKRRIALAAAALIEEGSTVGLTGGTTTTEVARALSEVPDLTIVTNALNIASELAIRSNLKLVVPGGVARSASYELVGPIAESALGGLNLDVVFVGVDGIAPEQGLTTHHEVEAYTNRVLIQRAARSVAVADSSKLGRVAFARICDVDEVDGLISDTEADREVIAALGALGTDIKLV